MSAMAQLPVIQFFFLGGGDPKGILDSGSLWNFRYHCVKGGIRELLAKWIWWRHLANNIALAEVPANYDCFLVENTMSLPNKPLYFVLLNINMTRLTIAQFRNSINWSKVG